MLDKSRRRVWVIEFENFHCLLDLEQDLLAGNVELLGLRDEQAV